MGLFQNCLKRQKMRKDGANLKGAPLGYEYAQMG
jgi:hypothetical protein